MKQFFTLIAAILLGSTVIGQSAFQSDLSSWVNGDPTDWVGSKTNLAASNYSEVTTGATYGTSMVNLINTGSSHKRFTTQQFAVTGGNTYEVKIYTAGLQGHVRTAFYDLTNAAYSSYNDYDSLEIISQGNLIEITQFINIPATCNDIELIVSLRNTDAVGFVIDSVSVALPANPPMPVPHTISEIQNNSGGTSAFEDSLVSTSGVVTAIKSGDGYWIQDGIGPWTGVYIKDDINTPSRGDSVTVAGIVAEVFGVTQIEFISVYTLEPSPSVAITPSVVSSADLNNLEDWEGVLVQVQNGECVNEDAGFGQWTINNGSNAGDSVLVDDDLYSFAPTLGLSYNVTGIGHYSFSASKLLPRDAADITAGTSGIKNESITFSMYPNPAVDQLLIESSVNAKLIIYNITGSEMYSGILNGVQFIDVSDYSAGIYLVKMIANGSAKTQKLVIK
jgi:hypothetical protein